MRVCSLLSSHNSIFQIRNKFLAENKRGSIFGFIKLLYGNDHYYSICTWLPRNHA